MHTRTLTWGLEVECDQLGATKPHGQRVIVGGVQPLSSGVNSGKLAAVVLQEALPSATCRKLLRLCLWEGGHVPVTCPLRPDFWKQQQITQMKKMTYRNYEKVRQEKESSLILTVLVEGDRSAVDHKLRQLHCDLLPPLHLLLFLHLLPWR